MNRLKINQLCTTYNSDNVVPKNLHLMIPKDFYKFCDSAFLYNEYELDYAIDLDTNGEISQYLIGRDFLAGKRPPLTHVAVPPRYHVPKYPFSYDNEYGEPCVINRLDMELVAQLKKIVWIHVPKKKQEEGLTTTIETVNEDEEILFENLELPDGGVEDQREGLESQSTYEYDDNQSESSSQSSSTTDTTDANSNSSYIELQSSTSQEEADSFSKRKSIDSSIEIIEPGSSPKKTKVLTDVTNFEGPDSQCSNTKPIIVYPTIIHLSPGVLSPTSETSESDHPPEDRPEPPIIRLQDLPIINGWCIFDYKLSNKCTVHVRISPSAAPD